MSGRKIKIQSGKEVVWMEVTEEEYQNYYRPWWQQKKAEQRNRETMEEKGYREESYEAWCDGMADDRGIPDIDAGSLEELAEKKMLLDVLEEAMESLLPNERELAEKVFGEDMSVCEYARLKGENRRTMAFRKGKVLDKLRDFFEDKGIEL